jgi:phosphoglycolate phosphatase
MSIAAPSANLRVAMRFQTFLFDLDGTLIDHFGAIHRCHSHAMMQLGLPAPTLAQVRAAVGGGLEVAIARLVGDERVATYLPIYRAHWDATMLDDVILLPGARELLAAARACGAKTAVFTNKHGPSSRAVCAHLGLSALLDEVVGAHDTPWLKPQPEFAGHLLGKLGADPATTLLVGDSPYDVQAARNAGLAGWCVTTGTHNAEELRAAGAEAVFTSLTEVQRALGL